MDFDAVLADGWETHHADAHAVAERLEAALLGVHDADRATRYTALVNHVIGGELADWERALRLDRQAIGTLPRDAALVPSLGNLAFAAYMAGDVARAMSAEVRAATLSPADAVPVFVRVNLLVAEALMHRKRWDESLELFHDTLLLAETMTEATPADRTVAIVCNNMGSAMLDLESRTPEQDELMARAARNARKFWLRTGDWKNDERSDYLLALVANALGRHHEALASVDRGLETIRANGEEPVDEAFLEVARAGACRGLGRLDEAAASLGAAVRLGASFPDPALRSWLEDELAKVRPAAG